MSSLSHCHSVSLCLSVYNKVLMMSGATRNKAIVDRSEFVYIGIPQVNYGDNRSLSLCLSVSLSLCLSVARALSLSLPFAVASACRTAGACAEVLP